ncbi:hypothetical protein B0H13DRAFT_2417597 [Mycena leptocephala]|nr:hypothetical protein B0H13DRAFT_2417597 [Mycena leptocephala]
MHTTLKSNLQLGRGAKYMCSQQMRISIFLIIDDYTLGRLIRDTPSRCILLIEDIDCAFPSREEDSDNEPLLDATGNPLQKEPIPPRSQITLAGLLNVLDSVASEEGRLTFATTNHIEQLDPALIRPGRMDLKEEYSFIQGWVLQQDVESIGISTRNAGLKPRHDAGCKQNPRRLSTTSTTASDSWQGIPRQSFTVDGCGEKGARNTGKQ